MPMARDDREIRHVLDLFGQAGAGNFPGVGLTPRNEFVSRIIADTLAWVLQVKFDGPFVMFRAELEREVARAGYFPEYPVDAVLARQRVADLVARLPRKWRRAVTSGLLTVGQASQRCSAEAIKLCDAMPPPAGDVCGECRRRHDAHLPHDVRSRAYRLLFAACHGRNPDWADAVAHCAEPLQGAVAAALGPAWPRGAVDGPIMTRLLAVIRRFAR